MTGEAIDYTEAMSEHSFASMLMTAGVIDCMYGRCE